MYIVNPEIFGLLCSDTHQVHRYLHVENMKFTDNISSDFDSVLQTVVTCNKMMAGLVLTCSDAQNVCSDNDTMTSS